MSWIVIFSSGACLLGALLLAFSVWVDLRTRVDMLTDWVGQANRAADEALRTGKRLDLRFQSLQAKVAALSPKKSARKPPAHKRGK